MLKETLLAAALTFQPWHGDEEEPEARRARLETIAQAIQEAVQVATCAPGAPSHESVTAASESEESEEKECQPVWRRNPETLGFLLLAQAYFETRLAKHVHEGNCRVHIGECDSGRAISLWQLQSGPHLPKEEWELLGSSDLESTRRAAVHAAVALGRGANYCGSLRGAIALYATGQSCEWAPAARRESFVRRLVERF